MGEATTQGEEIFIMANAKIMKILGLIVDIGRQMERPDTLRRIINSAADRGMPTRLAAMR